MTEPLGPKNQLVQQARAIARERKEREATGLAHLEGIRLAEEAMAARVDLTYALYSDDILRRERGEALLAAIRARGVETHRVTPEALERAADTQTPQGIVALFRPRPRTIAEMGPGLVVVLDNLQDPGNLGTVIRSLEALGGAGAVVSGGVDPYNPKVIRGAMGSLFRLPVVKQSLEQALDELAQQGRKLYVADAGGDLLPWQAGLAGGAALVIGNEGAGPSALARSRADGVISIPMEGPTESLNAGVAASLLIYEALRQRRG
ncbi:MAG: TrmH family RNA methyltransferase [Bacillota bacterium]